MKYIWLLIWFQVLPEQGVNYHHLNTFKTDVLCGAELTSARVMSNHSTETITCLRIELADIKDE
jgi:hypothetical protein|tara:strand:+ start:140 stop:331 length:192 start_codon:yes stop_codon:yes gene_type:complete